MAYSSYGSEGHSNKKQRGENGQSIGVGRMDSLDNEHKVAPSPVVHVRSLAEGVSERDISDAVRSFGTVNYVMNIPNKRMALIEFDSVNTATALVNYADSVPVFVGGRQALFNYSTSNKIKRPVASDSPANCVLLLTILNARHNITIEVINAVCSPIGTVRKIVIFRKNGVQAMVEFDSIETASRAKQTLQGADIYSGCCTIKAEFAKPTSLNVKRNDYDTWDFTVVQEQREMQMPLAKNQPLLADPTRGAGPSPYSYSYSSQQGYGAAPGANKPASMMEYSGYNTQSHMSGAGDMSYDYDKGDKYGSQMMSILTSAYETMTSAANSSMAIYQPDCVLMIYGLNTDRFNCQKVFNLFCIYGNVVRVKFLKTKENSAMMQLGDKEACERVLQMLNGFTCFGNKLQLAYSKQSYLLDVNNPHTLPDGTSAFKDFTSERNNRYLTHEAAAKNRPMPPTNVVYFFNAPPNISEDDIRAPFDEHRVMPPSKIKIFPPKTDKSSRGLLQWESVEACTEAISCVNNYNLPNPTGRSPYVFKLCFSQTRVDL